MFKDKGKYHALCEPIQNSQQPSVIPTPTAFSEIVGYAHQSTEASPPPRGYSYPQRGHSPRGYGG